MALSEQYRRRLTGKGEEAREAAREGRGGNSGARVELARDLSAPELKNYNNHFRN